MIEFAGYESRPITRFAYQIQSDDELQYNPDVSSTLLICGADPESRIEFKCYEKPQAGDYVVRLSDDDTYHCSKAVFEERNFTCPA